MTHLLIWFKTHCKWIYQWGAASPPITSARVVKVIELLCRYPEDPAASRRPTRRSLHVEILCDSKDFRWPNALAGGKVICAALISCGSMSVNPAVERRTSNVGGNTTAGLSIFQFRNCTERRKVCCAPAGSWTIQTHSQRSRFGKFPSYPEWF